MSTFVKFLFIASFLLTSIIIGETLILNNLTKKSEVSKNTPSANQAIIPTPYPTLPIPASFQYFSEGVRSFLIAASKLEVNYLGTISEISASEPYILTIENGMSDEKRDDFKFIFLPETFKKIEVMSGSPAPKKATFAELKIGDKVNITARYLLSRSTNGTITQEVESMKIEKK